MRTSPDSPSTTRLRETRFGNDDDRVDEIASMIVETFMDMIRQHPTYRDSIHTQSVLTITSNVVSASTPETPRMDAAKAHRSPPAPTP